MPNDTTPNDAAPSAREMEFDEETCFEAIRTSIYADDRQSRHQLDAGLSALGAVAFELSRLRAALAEAERERQRLDDLISVTGKHFLDYTRDYHVPNWEGAIDGAMEGLCADARRMQSLLAERDAQVGRMEEWAKDQRERNSEILHAIVKTFCDESGNPKEPLPSWLKHVSDVLIGLPYEKTYSAALATGPRATEETCPTCHEAEGPYCSNPWHLNRTPEAPDANA